MDFSNVPIVNPYQDSESDPELTLAANHTVDSLEKAFGIRFPDGYREYVTTLGKGTFYFNKAAIRIRMPNEILTQNDEHQAFLTEYWFWDLNEDLFPKKKGIESILVCDNVVGDIIVIHPSKSNELVALPHEDDYLHKTGNDLYEAFKWLGGLGDETRFEAFVPHMSFIHEVIAPEGFNDTRKAIVKP